MSKGRIDRLMTQDLDLVVAINGETVKGLGGGEVFFMFEI